MMNRWSLPKTLNVGGKDYNIRYQFGAVLDVLAAYGDQEMEEEDKAEVMMTIIYPELKDIPSEHIAEAYKKACEFIDCGQKDSGRPHKKIMDWSQDADLIIPAINNVAGMEVRANPELHWWTFCGYYMSIGDSLFSTVIHIRRKKTERKKLDKWEEEFYRENKHLIDLHTPVTEEIQAEKESILKYL